MGHRVRSDRRRAVPAVVRAGRVGRAGPRTFFGAAFFLAGAFAAGFFTTFFLAAGFLAAGFFTAGFCE